MKFPHCVSFQILLFTETASLDGCGQPMLEEGVQNMSLDQQPRLKLTLRVKRPPINPPGDPSGPPTSTPVSKDDFKEDELPNYEVYRMEGVENSRSKSGNSLKSKSPWRIRKRNRKRDISTCSSNSSGGSNSGLKRLKLRLGDETMSTIDLDSMMT